jgi:dGTP triphosphohydrolase
MKAAIIKLNNTHIDCVRTDVLEQIQDILEDSDICTMRDITDHDSYNALVMDTLLKSVPLELVESIDSVESNKSQADPNSADQNPSRMKYNITSTMAYVYEDRDYAYLCSFVSLEDLLHKDTITEEEYKTHSKTHSMNIFASQLTSSNVASDAIIVKLKIDYTIVKYNIASKMDYSSIVEYQFARDLESVFKHRGIVLSASGDKTGYFYIQQPLENVIMTDADYSKHYRYYEYEVFNHIVVMYIDIRESNANSADRINKTASELAGSTVYGDVLLSLTKKPMFDEQPSFISLSDKTFSMIHFLMSRSHDVLKLPGSATEYINFYKLLELSQQRYADLPVRQISSESLNVE